VGLIEWTPWQNIAQLQSIPAPNDYYWLQVKGTENPKSIRLQYTEQDLVLTPPPLSRQKNPSAIVNLTNFPNPCSPETTISFELKRDAELELSIYNLKGQKVREITKGSMFKGSHRFIWNGKDANQKSVASGIYIYKISSPAFVKTAKIVLIR
jgi:hypothetical protein